MMVGPADMSRRREIRWKSVLVVSKGDASGERVAGQATSASMSSWTCRHPDRCRARSRGRGSCAVLRRVRIWWVSNLLAATATSTVISIGTTNIHRTNEPKRSMAPGRPRRPEVSA